MLFLGSGLCWENTFSHFGLLDFLTHLFWDFTTYFAKGRIIKSIKRLSRETNTSGKTMSKFYLKLAGIVSVVGGVLVATGAKAGNYVDITTSSIASTTAYITDFFSDVSPFIWLAIGVPLAFFVIKKVIGLVAGRAR